MAKRTRQPSLLPDDPRELICDRTGHIWLGGSLVCACPDRWLWMADAWEVLWAGQ
jgi:hypothetical protein